jgi:hypothetical protein
MSAVAVGITTLAAEVRMTISNPSEGPTLLASLVRADHDHILSLLDDAAVRTPTPGVRADVTRLVVEAVTAHSYAEAQIVEPAVRSLLGDPEADRVQADTDKLLSLARRVSVTLDADSVALDELRVALVDHCRVLDDRMMPAMAGHDAHEMAFLGYRFGDALEAAPRRPAGRA